MRCMLNKFNFISRGLINYRLSSNNETALFYVASLTAANYKSQEIVTVRYPKG